MQRFKNILCYLGTERNESAINRSIQLARENDGSVTFMDVVKPPPLPLKVLPDMAEPQQLQEFFATSHREKLLKRAAEYADSGVPIDVAVSIGDPASEIVRRVLTHQHDLVVKTADGLSPAGRLFGSVASSLLRLCPCPVWLLKPEIHGDFDRVLAAVDMAADDPVHHKLNQDILELAFSIAQRGDADLFVVSAGDLPMEQPLRHRMGDDQVDKMLAKHEQRVHRAIDELLQAPYAEANNVHVTVDRGPAANVVRAFADQIEADLLVMGTLCRTPTAGVLIGSTAETLLSDVTCSVIALKPPGFETPVQLDRNESIQSHETSSLL